MSLEDFDGQSRWFADIWEIAGSEERADVRILRVREALKTAPDEARDLLIATTIVYLRFVLDIQNQLADRIVKGEQRQASSTKQGFARLSELIRGRL